MKASLLAALALGCVVTTRLAAQSPLTGFWTRTSIQCSPPTMPRCKALHGATGSWADSLAVNALRDTVLVTGPQLAFVAHVDTFAVDGVMIRWSPGRRGFYRTANKPFAGDPAGYVAGPQISRPLWTGESWTVSPDGRTLTHKYVATSGADSVRIVLIYVRSSR